MGKKLLLLREGVRKKYGDTWGQSKSLLVPPLGTLDCYFISHIWALGNEMDFEMNLFYSSQKCSDT